MITETTQTGVGLLFPLLIGNYRYVNTIGKGGTCVVARVENTKTKQYHAAKIVSRKDLMDQGIILMFEQELRVHQNLHHENIVQIEQVVFLEDYIFVVMELCANGDLFEWAQKGVFSNTMLARKTIYQLISALSYLHARNIAHMDLKPENILLDADFRVKLTDFGCCETPVQKVNIEYYGTLYYTAPEIFSGKLLDRKKADIWSLGVIVYTMVVGDLPWSDGTDEEIRAQIISGSYEVPSFVHRELSLIIKSCLQVDPLKRPDINTLKSIQWLIIDEQPKLGSNRKRLRESATHHAPLLLMPKSRNSNILQLKPMIVKPGKKKCVQETRVIPTCLSQSIFTPSIIE